MPDCKPMIDFTVLNGSLPSLFLYVYLLIKELKERGWREGREQYRKVNHRLIPVSLVFVSSTSKPSISLLCPFIFMEKGNKDKGSKDWA